MGTGGAYRGDSTEEFAARSGTGLNAYHDRPAMLDLIGDVSRAVVLDLGCGAGQYLAELIGRGATVTGVDGSEVLLGHARDRVGPGVTLQLHDLEEPLGFAEDGSFDGVVCALVLHHVADRAQLLDEIYRVLRPGGWLAVSTTHPAADWGKFGRSYFSRDWVDRPFGRTGSSIRYQLMPMEDIIGELLDAGFLLRQLREPRPTAPLMQIDPERFEALDAAPVFVAMRLQRPV
jgi:SAM-dependent methyltransferase